MARKKLSELMLPQDAILFDVKRGDEHLLPKGDLVLKKDDVVILLARSFEEMKIPALYEIAIDKDHEWAHKKLANLKLEEQILIALIQRGDNFIIPNGDTFIMAGDVLVLRE